MNRELEIPAGVVGWAGLGWAPRPWKYWRDLTTRWWSAPCQGAWKREQQTREKGLCRIIGDCKKLPYQMDI